MNETANRAIRATVVDGIVRNVSIMAPAPFLSDAAEVLSDLADSVDFGLHVCLTAEWSNLRWGPVSPAASVASLTRKDGTLPYDCDELSALSPDPEQMLVEVGAQLDKLTAAGFDVRYLDEHMGVGQVGNLSAALVEFAEEKGLVCHRRLSESQAFVRPEGWDGPGEHPGTELADFLSGLSAGTYLFVGHPSYKSEEMEQLHLPSKPRGHAMFPRNRQRRMFADIEIVDYCRNGGIELLRYSQL
jgi:hypothetical protein